RCHGGGALAQRAEVVETPVRAALGGEDEVAVGELDVGDRGDRQIELEGLPVGAVVEGDVHAEFGAGIEEAGADRILADDTGGLVGGDAIAAVGEQGPMRTEIVGAVDVGGEVAEQIAIDGGVGGGSAVGRGFDVLDAALGLEASGGDVLPGLAVVAGDIDQAVIGAGPDDPGLDGRFADGVEGAVNLFAGGIAGDGLAAGALGARRMGGEIGGDGFPGDAAVAGAVEELRAVVDDMGVVGGDLHGRDALEAVEEGVAAIAVEGFGADPVLLLVVGADVLTAELPLAAAVNDVGIGLAGDDGTGLAAGTEIVGGRMIVDQHAAGKDHGIVVLLGTVDAVGELVIHGDLVDLRGGLVELAGPGLAAIERNVGAAVVGLDHVERVLRVDP